MLDSSSLSEKQIFLFCSSLRLSLIISLKSSDIFGDVNSNRYSSTQFCIDSLINEIKYIIKSKNNAI